MIIKSFYTQTRNAHCFIPSSYTHPPKYHSQVFLCYEGVSWPSGLHVAYRTQVLVLAAECGFESRP